MKFLTTPIVHWIMLGIINLFCIATLIHSPFSYQENTSYHTISRQWLEDLSQLNTEDYVTVGHGRFTQSTIESMSGKLRNATISADVIRANKDRIQLRVNHVKLSQDDELFAIEKTPDLFFRRQYVLQEGAVLNYEFFRPHSKNTVCFYIHELGRLRCMNK